MHWQSVPSQCLWAPRSQQIKPTASLLNDATQICSRCLCFQLQQINHEPRLFQVEANSPVPRLSLCCFVSTMNVLPKETWEKPMLSRCRRVNVTSAMLPSLLPALGKTGVLLESAACRTAASTRKQRTQRTQRNNCKERDSELAEAARKTVGIPLSVAVFEGYYWFYFPEGRDT